MRGRTAIFLLALLAACGDPETGDERGYTKAPLENPGLLVAGEDASPMAELGEPDLPRPQLESEAETSDGGEADGGADAPAAEVTLAPGVTREQYDRGRELFAGQGGCTACHGPNGGGSQLGPNLTDGEWLHVPGPEVAALAEVIGSGVAQPVEFAAPMPPMGGASLDEGQVEALASYVASLSQG